MKQINKVAPITLLFWLMKVVATTLGETLGDFLSMTLGQGYVIGLLITLALFVVALLLQLASDNYVPTKYWLVIIGTTTLGTEISDFMDRTLHFGYLLGSLVLLSLLLLVLLSWYRQFKNLEVYPIFQRSKELYFWIAVLISNSLGTAFGDFLSDNLGFTYLQGASIAGLIILTVILLHYFSRLNPVVLFWIAFIFTRPFGATFGDLLTKPVKNGGWDIGTRNASLVCLALMFIMLVLSHAAQRRKARVS